ncbi:MAG: Uma2 family endonuclease [Acidobacteria bacterium]|nr:Uma2 family endonuclease [Acidobacteriota bacterium]
MGTKTLISADEYLRTPYEGPEPDFIEGEVVPRSMPNTPHSKATLALISLFIRQAPKTLLSLPELRIRIMPEHFRIADIAAFDREPFEDVPEVPPLIVVEVLSPDDIHAELMRRFADFESLGVPHIWLVDPIAKRFAIYHDESLTATTQFSVPAHGVLIRLTDIFIK